MNCLQLQYLETHEKPLQNPWQYQHSSVLGFKTKKKLFPDDNFVNIICFLQSFLSKISFKVFMHNSTEKLLKV